MGGWRMIWDRILQKKMRFSGGFLWDFRMDFEFLRGFSVVVCSAWDVFLWV